METATRDTRGRFKPGCSGNPAGKQPGTLNHATRLRQWLDAEHEEQAARALIARAGEGNVAALRILFDRIDPKPKPRAQPIAFALPDGASFTQRFEAVFAAMAAGAINPEEGLQLARFLETFRTIAEQQAAGERAAAAAAKQKAEWDAYVEQRDAKDRQRATAEAKALEAIIAAAGARAAAVAKARAEAKAATAAPAKAPAAPPRAADNAAPPRRDPREYARPWPASPASQSLNPTCISRGRRDQRADGERHRPRAVAAEPSP